METGIIDSGCTQGIAGGNMQLISWNHEAIRGVTVRGYGDSAIQEYRIGTFGTLAHDTLGQAVILVFPQYLGDGTASPNLNHTLHSTLQLRDNNVKVYDTPQSQGGRQQVVISDRRFGLHINGGHITLPFGRYSADEWEHLDKIVVTRTRPWDPDRYDGSVTTNSSANDWVNSIDLNVARYNEPIATDTVQSYLYLIMQDTMRGLVGLKESYTGYMDGVPLMSTMT
jgi:hypothetical protein